MYLKKSPDGRLKKIIHAKRWMRKQRPLIEKYLEGEVFACTVIHFDLVIARRVHFPTIAKHPERKQSPQ
jgi:hypothetical protein